jgi:hypothetical protein
MTELGQKRRFGDVRLTSALPLKADIHREVRHVRFVPTTEVACMKQKKAPDDAGAF